MNAPNLRRDGRLVFPKLGGPEKELSTHYKAKRLPKAAFNFLGAQKDPKHGRPPLSHNHRSYGLNAGS